MKYKYHYNYMITNLNNHKRYIGVRSCNCWPTEDNKYNGSSKYLKEIMLKEGSEWFKKEIIAIWYTRELAVEHEIRLHKHFEVGINSMFYNKSKQTNTGFDTTGIIATEETRNNISNGRKGHIVTEETRKKIGNFNKNKYVSKKTREKISNKNKGKKLSINTCKKMSDSRRDHIVTEETRKKLSDSKFGSNNPMYNKKFNNTHKSKLSKASKGRKHINKNGINKMIFKNELDYYLNNGWRLGRK